MSVSRRSFVKTVGLGGAGLSASLGAGRTSEAMAAQGAIPATDQSAIIRLSNNENNRGPGARTIEAIRASLTAGIGRGYPPDHVNELIDTIAGVERVGRSSIVVGTGSGPILEGSIHAFCSPAKALVTAAPTYAATENAARRVGVPVKLIPVDTAMALDLDAMAEASKGAGLVYLCNPNNPTGCAHPGATIGRFVQRVKEMSPGTAILVDEAYLHYAHDPVVHSVAALAGEYSGVFITRSFSKAHGMAGLRLGYAIGQADTVQAIARAWQLGSVNTLTAAAGIASLEDTQHIAEEVAENARVREFTLRAFKDMGFTAPDSHANCVFFDIKAPASAFRDACMKAGVQVGRDFPPFEKTYTRITLGTMDEMQRAVGVFRRVLNSTRSTSA